MRPFRFGLILTLLLCLHSTAQSDRPVLQEPPNLPSAPSSGDTVFAAPRRLLRQGKNAEAIAQLQQIQAVNPDMKGLAHDLGVAYYKCGDDMKALEALKKATSEDPQDNEAVQLLGR